EPLMCANGHRVVARPDQVVERAFERAFEQAGKGVDRIRAALEGDGLSVREAYALDRVDARAELGLIRCRVALARREHSCPCGDAEPAELIRERRGAGELELRLGDERAPVAALAAHEAAATIEGVRFHALWLRDNCPCSECRHESGQRLLDTRSLPDDLEIVAVDGCTVSFSDGHVSSFDAGWLQANAGEAPPSPRTLWGAELQDELPAARYDDVTAGGPALRDWLAAVDELGFAILTGGPTEPGTVTRVAELFGFVRETNYGRLFDVRTVVNPTNLAYTGLGLGAHSDNPYREPTPTMQLLHCLASSA